MDLEREKDKYTKDVTEKTKSIAELQARIAQLDLDDSREAQAEKRKLQEQLAEEQSALAETQADHAYEATSDMLDDMADAYEKEKQKEIEILQDSISSAEKIYQLAIDRIDNHWNTLYYDLINWNYQYGNTVQSELISAWNDASAAVQQYGSYLNAVAATQAQIATFDVNSGLVTVSTTGNYDTSGGASLVPTIIAQMEANSEKWYNLKEKKDQVGLDNLEADQQKLAAQLRKALPGMNIERKSDGTWYINGEELYKSKYAKYHTGGIVGDNSTSEQDEMFALLEKGEAVLTEPQQKVFYRILDTSETLANKLGIRGLYGGMNGNSFADAQSQNAIKREIQEAQAVSGNGSTSQTIGTISVPVQVMVTEKLDKSDLQRLSREIGNIASQEIYETFVRGGKTTMKGRMLRP